MAQGFAKAEFADPGWQDYTPTYNNLTIGNGTVVARYQQIGTLVTVHFVFTLGSTSAVGTAPDVSTPVTAASSYTVLHNIVGLGRYKEDGGSGFLGYVRLSTTDIIRLQTETVTGNNPTETNLSATLPHTWGTSDIISFTATYEAATSTLLEMGANNDHGSLSGLTDDDHTFYPKGVLGQATLTSNQTGITSTPEDVTGVTVTATVAADRMIKISATTMTNVNTNGATCIVKVYEDATAIQRIQTEAAGANDEHTSSCVVYTTPTAASHTWKLTLEANGGTGSVVAGGEYPCILIVEDVGSAL